MNSVLIKYTGEYNWYSQMIRGLAEVLFISFLFRAKCYQPVLILVFFLFSNLMGMLLLYGTSEKIELDEFYQNFVIVNKMLYFFVVYFVISVYFRENFKIEKLFYFFEFCFLVYVASIFIGFIFQIDIFRSYAVGARFGFKGVIVTTNEAVGLLLIGFFYFYMKYLTYYRKYDIAVIYSIFFCSIIVGSKASVFFSILSLVLLIGPQLKSKRFFLTFFVFIAGFVVISLEYLVDKFEVTMNYFYYFYNRGDAIVSILLTGRDWRLATLIEELFIVGDYPIYNYIFGGFNFVRLGTEMDVFDILTAFGFMGVVYYYLYISYFFRLSKCTRYSLIFLIIFLTASSLGGHLIYNAVIPAYLVILCLRFRSYAGIRSQL
ncbi:hypothetical protein [Hahella ganghwensis]|uniref:hypothetical protein n=1 Tax=Hahella ganghwensis TaxID=286420 RepID=UPI0012FBB51F|nr:hypothetical protein [Hahella ganghwensis]